MMRYVAFGLQLISHFALPGMLERSEDSLPQLELDIRTRASVESDWDALGAREIWEGKLGDGRTLLVLRGTDGALLFEYGSRALFKLDPSAEHLDCAPSEDGIAWQRILLTKVLANVALIRGYEALHASAVEAPQGAVVVLAASGTGKTALALALAKHGLPLLSDDIVILEHGADGVRAHPGTPHLNADPRTVSSHATRKLALVLGVLGEELWLAARSSSSTPRPVHAVCVLERGPFLSLDVEAMPASPLALMPYMLGLHDDEGRERQRFTLYSELMASAKLIRISAGERHSPDAIATRLRMLIASDTAHMVGALA